MDLSESQNITTFIAYKTDMNRLKAILASVFLFSAIPLFGQSLRKDTIIPSADLRSDVALLRRVYEELHPGIYRYVTKTQMDANFAKLDAEFRTDRTLADAYLAYSVFLAKIKCGHSYANFFNQTNPISSALFKQQDKVPFHFRWLDGTMIITKNFSKVTDITPGSEVVSINGVRTDEILAKLLTVARADGSNDAKRIAYMEVLGNDRFEAFDIFYPLFYPLKTTGFELEVKPFGKKIAKRYSVEALTYEQRLAGMNSAGDSSDNDAPAFTVAYAEPNIAVLRMPGWALYNSKWAWKKFIDDTMDDLATRGIENLVLDIRGNEGGLDVGNAIIAHLIDKDLPLSATNRFVRYKKIPADLKPFLDTWDRSFDDWGTGAHDPKDGLYRLTRYDDFANGSLIKPFGKRFKGRVFVLVGATNSSATFQFAQTIKVNKLGILVGQPTGGNQRGINGGAFYFLRLPKTKIEVDLPLIGQFSANESPDAGIVPDIYVKPKASDIALGKDPEIDAVRRILKIDR